MISVLAWFVNCWKHQCISEVINQTWTLAVSVQFHISQQVNILEPTCIWSVAWCLINLHKVRVFAVVSCRVNRWLICSLLSVQHIPLVIKHHERVLLSRGRRVVSSHTTLTCRSCRWKRSCKYKVRQTMNGIPCNVFISRAHRVDTCTLLLAMAICIQWMNDGFARHSAERPKALRSRHTLDRR